MSARKPEQIFNIALATQVINQGFLKSISKKSDFLEMLLSHVMAVP